MASNDRIELFGDALELACAPHAVIVPSSDSSNSSQSNFRETTPSSPTSPSRSTGNVMRTPSRKSIQKYSPYRVKAKGENYQGNQWDKRIQPAGKAYHYRNADGSYYYKNGDNSKHYNNGKGYSQHTAPDGTITRRKLFG
ncbi:hypothetical protein B0J14DRAFT_351617 [Halenospora varia]|nr:hypothetical protein B0J14DRAFT_351617 [Halenospora varia]